MEPPSTIADLLHASHEAEHAGDLAAALRHAQDALVRAQQAANSEQQAHAYIALAQVHIRLGHYPTAQGLLSQAVALSAPNSPAHAEALHGLGVCAGETDDLAAAEGHFQQAIDLARQLGLDRLLVRSLHSMAAVIYTPRGEFALALAADTEALDLMCTRGLPDMTWGPLVTMSWVYWLSGQREAARATLVKLSAAAPPGSLAEAYYCLTHAGLALDEGATAEAQEWLTRARANAEASGITDALFFARLGTSRLCRLSGDTPSARAWAAEALALTERSGYRHLQGLALVERGRAAWLLGQLSLAEADFRAALAVLEPLRANFDLARAALLLAALRQTQQADDADALGVQAVSRILDGGYAFLLEQERALAFPLLATYLTAPTPKLRALSAQLLPHLERTPPPPLHVWTLGRFEVQQGARRIEAHAWHQRRAGELFRLLLVAPEYSLGREQVIEALWPDREPGAATAQLHQATSALRRVLEPDLPDKFPSRYLLFDEGVVRLCLPPGSWVDHVVFTQLARAQRFEEALTLWGGEPFPDDRYADWAALPCEELCGHYLRVLLALAQHRFEAGEMAEARDLCRRLLAEEPWHEEAVLLGMRACVALRDRVGAIRLYRALEAALRDELDIAPQAALQALYHSLL